MENKCNGTVPEYKAIQEEAPYTKLTKETLDTAISEAIVEVFCKKAISERKLVIYSNDKNFLKKFDEAMKEEVSKM